MTFVRTKMPPTQTTLHGLIPKIYVLLRMLRLVARQCKDTIVILLGAAMRLHLDFREQQQAGNWAQEQESFDNADRVADAIIAAYEDDGIKLYFDRDKRNAKVNGENIRHTKGTRVQFEGGKSNGEGCKFSAEDAVAIRSKLWDRICKNIKQRIPHCSFAESENVEYPSGQI